MADMSGVEQFSLCVLYGTMCWGKVNADFLQFVPVYDLSIEGLAKVVVDSLCKYGIDVQYLHSRGMMGLLT